MNVRIRVRALEVRQAGLDGRRDRDGRRGVHRHALDENAGNEGRDLVREGVDEGGDAKDTRVCGRAVSDYSARAEASDPRARMRASWYPATSSPAALRRLGILVERRTAINRLERERMALRCEQRTMPERVVAAASRTSICGNEQSAASKGRGANDEPWDHAGGRRAGP